MSRLSSITFAAILLMAAIFAFPYLQRVDAAAPTNDDFYSATVVPALPFSDVVDVKDATIGSYDYVYESCLYTPNKSVWYTFTPAETMAVKFDTTGSTFTPGMEIFTGTDYQTHTLVSCQGSLTQFDFTLTGGTTYYIMVFAPSVPYPGGEDLQWILNFSITSLAATNDHFADAKVISALPFSETVDTRAATQESGEPSPCGNPPYFSVWYRYTPASTEAVQIVTSNNYYYPVVVGVYTGSDLAGLTPYYCRAYNSSVPITLYGGVAYNIQVVANANPYPYPSGGITGGTLAFELKRSPLSNDNFETAMPVTQFPFSHWYDRGLATIQPGEPNPSCLPSPYIQYTAWYKVQVASDGKLTSGVTLMFNNYYNGHYLFHAIYTGDALDDLTEITCRTGDSYGVETNLTAGQAYWIQTGITGTIDTDFIRLDLGFAAKPVNDDFAGALVVENLPYNFQGSTSGATAELNEPVSSCNDMGANKTMWFKYLPASTGSLTAKLTGKTYGNYMNVYIGTDFSNLTEVDCRYGSGNLTFRGQAGVPYYIQIGSDLHGDLVTLDLFVPPPPVIDFVWSPLDASVFDSVQFCDQSSDPVNAKFAVYAWSYGGPFSNTKDVCEMHWFSADGSYTVCHKATTYDGREGTTCKAVAVKTHDVAITKLLTPKSGRVGQNGAVTVGVQNTRYAETVQVDLYKVTAGGDVFLGTLTQKVPVMPAYQTKDFKFTYKFTMDDANAGSVTFKAVATLLNYRDAKPDNNTIVAKSIRVTR